MIELEEPMTTEKPQQQQKGPALTRPGAQRPVEEESAGPSGNGKTPEVNVPGQAPTETHAEVEAETHVLTVDKFKLWYGKRQALHGIDMKIAGGKVTALIGPSGCGKSTLIRSMTRLNGLVEGVRIEGDMRFRGQSIYDKHVDVIDLRKRL